jgi:hypothetical protein
VRGEACYRVGVSAASPGEAAALPRGRTWQVFAASVSLTLLVRFLPLGGYVAWPLLLLSTLAHELGHGLTAVALGAEFRAFHLWPDGSGQAAWAGDVGRAGRALVAAGGLVGPAVAALAGFLFGRGPRRARSLLVLGGSFLVVTLVWVVRNPFGWLFVGLVAAALLALGIWAQGWLAQLAVVFLSVQLASAVFTRADYLFTPVADTASGRFPSDVAQMAEALWLPYWFWGALCAALSLAVLLLGLRFLLAAGPGGPSPRSAA